MPLFDVSEISFHDIPIESISSANEAVGALRNRLVDNIAISVMPNTLISSMTCVFFQGHTRRSLMFIEGGYDAYKRGHTLVTYSCARAIFETFACVLDYCDKLTDSIGEDSFPETAYFVYRRIFAARMEEFIDSDVEFNNTAINVLTQIDRVSKQFPGLRKDYDLLSERTHPNGLGALLHFWESGDQIVNFSRETDGHLALKSLVSAGHLLSLMEHGMSVMETILNKRNL